MSINPYYSPAELGLTIVDTLDASEGYDFNLFVLWLHSASGRLFYAQDSGCSCPTPFEGEDFNGPDDNTLQEVSATSFLPFEQAVNGFPVDADERKTMLDAVLKLLT